MKLSDYIAQFLAEQGIGHVFVITGGCIVHTIDSLAKRDDIKYIPVQHEQAGAMAADAYARVTGGMGAALATSGPGATNLLTGVCCAYYDSIPTIFITGQVPSGQLKRASKSRQIGFQETDVVSIFSTVTKYAVLVDDPKRIRYELEKAVYLARSGRPGPVLLDVCDDVQRADIDPEKLEGFRIPDEKHASAALEAAAEECVRLMREAKRPVIIPGGGIRLSNTVQQFRDLADRAGFPVAPTWAAVDFLPYTDPRVVGTFGVSSERAGNFVVQNADFVLALGTRLDTHEIGPRASTFARGAKKVVVDLDQAELDKYGAIGLRVDLPVCADLRDFFAVLLKKLAGFKGQDLAEWRSYIDGVKSRYPICPPQYRDQEDKVNPYVFMETLSQELPDEAVVIPDCGGNLIWTMQGLHLRGRQRLITSFNHSPMGYSVPASMGAAFATSKPVICITGDGGCQMNVQELATIAYYQLPVKIFLLDNHGHGIIKQTLDTWLNSRYHAINTDSGLAMPDLVKVAQAYGIKTESIGSHAELGKVRDVLAAKGPIFCRIDMRQDQVLEPKLVFGRPIEDSAPLLDRAEFKKNMLVPPLDEPKVPAKVG